MGIPNVWTVSDSQACRTIDKVRKRCEAGDFGPDVGA